MPLRWRSKPRFDVPRPASGRLPAISRRSPYWFIGYLSDRFTVSSADEGSSTGLKGNDPHPC
jgi:hypothetical protein